MIRWLFLSRSMMFLSAATSMPFDEPSRLPATCFFGFRMNSKSMIFCVDVDHNNDAFFAVSPMAP
jgi:hypothetical protein